MIIGKGDIASVLNDKKGICFFASGVSNSSETKESEFQREINLLMETSIKYHSSRLVYFSTLSIYYKDTPYTRHKRRMEGIVKTNFRKHCIVRLGNIKWGRNPNTIINYFKNNPNAEIQEGYRYLVDKDEFLHWIDLIPNFNTEMNITGKLTPIKQIYETAVYSNK